MQGKVHLTAFLKEPEGVWEQDVPFECPPGKQKAAAMQVVLGLLSIGLVRTLGDDEFELIPMLRVKTINVKINEQTIGLAGSADLAQATAAADTGKLVKL